MVITVIVIIVLAGIAIANLTGNNSMIDRAQEAKKTSEDSRANEELTLADYVDEIARATGGSSNGVRTYSHTFEGNYIYKFEISRSGDMIEYVKLIEYHGSELIINQVLLTNIALEDVTETVTLNGPGSTTYTVGTNFKKAVNEGVAAYINNSLFYCYLDTCYYEFTLDTNSGGGQVQTGGGTASVKNYVHNFTDGGNTQYRIQISRDGDTLVYIKLVSVISGGVNYLDGEQTVATNLTLENVTETTNISGGFTIGTNYKTTILNGNRIYLNDSYFYDIQGSEYVQYVAE